MNNRNNELTLLSEEEIWGNKKLDVLKKYGTISAITDLVVLTGGHCEDSSTYKAPDDNSLKGRTGWFYTSSSDGKGYVRCVDSDGSKEHLLRDSRNGAIRPVLPSSRVLYQFSSNTSVGHNGVEEIEYGEYPQYVPDIITQKTLEDEYKKGKLQATGRDYTFDKTKYYDQSQCFQPVKYDEYEYFGKKYIRVKANSDYYDGASFQLSNGENYKNGDFVWVEVSPVKWLVDRNTETLLSKVGLLSGIRFHNDSKYYNYYNGDFKTTEMKEYLNKYMLRDLTQNQTLIHTQTNSPEDYFYREAHHEEWVRLLVRKEEQEYKGPLTAELEKTIKKYNLQSKILPYNYDDNRFKYELAENSYIIKMIKKFNFLNSNRGEIWLEQYGSDKYLQTTISCVDLKLPDDCKLLYYDNFAFGDSYKFLITRKDKIVVQLTCPLTRTLSIKEAQKFIKKLKDLNPNDCIDVEKSRLPVYGYSNYYEIDCHLPYDQIKLPENSVMEIKSAYENDYNIHTDSFRIKNEDKYLHGVIRCFSDKQQKFGQGSTNEEINAESRGRAR